tara:strand:- start:62 stop:265 length:204 start_codon:yes stop_codon:yes gene_type:complete
MDNTEAEQKTLTKDILIKAAINSVDVLNTKESYENYFKLGGTVAQMNFKSTKKYQEFVKNRNKNKDE